MLAHSPTGYSKGGRIGGSLCRFPQGGLNGSSFEQDFKDLTGHTPMRWQVRLYNRLLSAEGLPRALDLPTGLGKTAVIAIWYLARRAGARLPRRLVYVVDRRAVVDQATTVADSIREKSGDERLRVSTLRGQHVDKREWLEDPAAPAIIVGTVDMIGSRLLFEGYGVSRRMRPYHAGLLGADTLVVLDESHLVPPFERLLDQISERADLKPKEERDRRLIPVLRQLALSATGRDADGDIFRLSEEDCPDPVAERRLAARKRLTIKPAGDGKPEKPLAQAAWGLADRGRSPVRILVYCDSRETAEETKAAIEKLAKGDKLAIETELFVGARRVKERVDAAEKLKALRFLAGSREPLDKPAFVIATSAGEVGVDLDADHMVCDLVPWERMVQRFGRVNRLGGDDRTARISLITEPPKPTKSERQALDKQKEGQKKLEDKEQKSIASFEAKVEAARRYEAPFEHLPKHGDEIDVSPGALRDLKLRAASDEAVREMLAEATTPAPLYPALTRPLVDAWAMTSLDEHTGRPEVQPWLRGWIEDDQPQTTVVWRTYLPVREQGGEATRKEIEDFFEAAEPHLSEKLEAETWRVIKWLRARAAEGAKREDGERPVVAAIALESNGSLRKAYRLHELRANDNKKESDKAFAATLAGATLIVDARLAGLRDGLLNGDANEPPSTADGEDIWPTNSAGEPLLPFRVRRVTAGEGEAEPPPATDRRWRAVHAFDLAHDAEGQALVQLIVENWRSEATGENTRSVAARDQFLAEHQGWAASRAQAIVEALGLDQDLANAIVLAARLHDEGKAARRWQEAFNAPSDAVYAKTRGPLNLARLGGYRHEFGSLLRVERNNALAVLPDEFKDLVLHLIAAHHGRARPVIETDGCDDDGPPSLLQARARDVALRFARLQKRFGPWGLAWLEALVRAADQQASRALESENSRDG